MTFWRRHWFLVGLGIVSICGFVAPGGGTALRHTGWALPALTALSLFLSGLTLETAELREGIEARGLALGLSSTYLVAPLLAVGLVRLWGPADGPPGSEGYFFFEAMVLACAATIIIASKKK